MKEAISKEGKKICDPNQVGNYGSDPISRKKNQELLPTNSNPKIYHVQMDKVWKDFCVLSHCQNFEQWVVQVVAFTYLVSFHR